MQITGNPKWFRSTINAMTNNFASANEALSLRSKRNNSQ